MSIRVRPPKAEDRPMWLTLFKGYIDFYAAAVPDDVIDTLWQRLMAGGEGLPIALLAVDATDRPVGLAHVLYHRVCSRLMTLSQAQSALETDWFAAWLKYVVEGS